MNLSIKTQKHQLRSQLRQTRQKFSQSQQQQAANNCAQRLIQSEFLKNADTFALYLATDGELNPQPLIKHLWQQEKEVYLPVVDGKHLLFAQYQADTVLTKSSYGILEPKDAKTCPAEQLDVIFLPLVAFDQFGQRLGMGGGFYDRVLSKPIKAKTIGLAHGFQQQSKLPSESWDQPLAAIATPEKLFFIKSTAFIQ